MMSTDPGSISGFPGTAAMVSCDPFPVESLTGCNLPYMYVIAAMMNDLSAFAYRQKRS